MTKLNEAKVGKKDAPEVPVSAEKKELQRIFDAYKIKNPVKYEQKKASFEKRLAAL